MAACTFFGHRDCPDRIEAKLRRVLLDLIDHHGVDRFYVGNQGQFDSLAYHTVRELKKLRPHIDLVVVLAYFPLARDPYCTFSPEETIVADGIEDVHPRYAISHRNRWMIDRSDYAVVYVKRSYGGAKRFADLAERKKKTVLRLADMP